MPPRKIHPSEDLVAVAQDAACVPDPVGVVAVGVAVAGVAVVGAAIVGAMGVGVEADTGVEVPATDGTDATGDVDGVAGSTAIVLSVA
jgi:NADPH-dependent 2,4-dienoyl-CoA reductase/sulfur reductase-like enzyme